MNLKVITIALSVVLLCNCQSPNNGEDTETVDISGTWVGIAYQMSDIPEEPNVSITFIFSQSGEEVTGSFHYWGHADTIVDGSIINSVLSLKTNISTVGDIYYHFGGTVFQDSIGGEWSVVNLTTNEPYTTQQWYVNRERSIQ